MVIIKNTSYPNNSMPNRISNKISEKYALFRKSRYYQIIKRINALKRTRQFIGWNYGIWLLSKFRLHGDRIHLALLKKVFKDYKITSIVETGTFLGYTTALFAEEFPDVQIYTAEINPRFYQKAKKNLKKYKNVHIYNNNSPDFLNKLLKENVLGKRPLFYLDAHWLDDWPLEKELQIISKNIPSAVISIDDFKVEGDKRFVYDKYGAVECSLELVNPNLYKNNYRLLFPNYDGNKIFGSRLIHPALIGYTIIFQNMNKEFEHLKKSNIVKNNYLDKSNLINIKRFVVKKK